MSDARSAIVVTVALGKQVHALTDAPGLAGATGERIGALAADLGIPGQVDVTVTRGEMSPSRPIGVFVHGNQVDYPSFLDQQVLMWRRHIRDPAGTGGTTLPSWQDQLAADDADSVLAAAEVAAGAVAANANALLGPAQLTTWLESAGMAAGDGIGEMLATLLSLRLSIGDHARVTGILAAQHDAPLAEAIEDVIEALRAPTLDILVEPAYLEEFSTSEFAAAREMFRYLRDAVYEELGLRLPPLRLIPDATLADRCFAVRVNDVTTVPFVGVPPGQCLVNETAMRLALDVPHAQSALNPGNDAEGAYVPATSRDALTEKGYATWDPLGNLILAVAETARTYVRALIDRAVVTRELDRFAIIQPVLANSAQARLPLRRLTRLTRALLDERVSVRDLRRLLQALIDQETLDGLPVGDDALLALARHAYRGAITSSARQRDIIQAYLVAPALVTGLVAGDERRAREARRALVTALDAELATLPTGSKAPVLVTTASLRLPVRRAIRGFWPRLTVVAHEELEATVSMYPLGRLSAASS